MTDLAAGWRWFRNPWARRGVFGVLIVLTALLALFPQRYEANVKLAPQETSTAGLSAILSQLGGNYAALLGSQQPVEIDLTIGRSFEVQSTVAKRAGLVPPNAGRAELDGAIRELEKMVDVRALRGNIIEIVASGSDADATLKLVAVYAKAMQDRLAQLSRTQTTYKRGVLDERMREASGRLARAEGAISRFRAQNQVIAPDEQLSAAVAQLSALRSQYQATQIELAKARRTNTEQSFPIRSLRSALAAIQAQISSAERQARSNNGLTASGIAPRAIEFERLTRELRFAQSLYDSYTRYLEGAAIEELTANFNMQIVEPPFLEPNRQFNLLPLALLAIIALIATASEFYMFRPPPGRRSVAA